jgi:hypothetical protein
MVHSLATGARPWRRPRAPDPPRFRPHLEALEDRNLLSAGLSPTLVDLKGATPLPIPFPLALAANPLGGPDIYQNLPGPADAAAPIGNEPNGITNFDGFYAGARVQGSGTDGQGNTLYWDADLRVMQGVYQGLDGAVHRGTFVEV